MASMKAFLMRPNGTSLSFDKLKVHRHYSLLSEVRRCCAEIPNSKRLSFAPSGALTSRGEQSIGPLALDRFGQLHRQNVPPQRQAVSAVDLLSGAPSIVCGTPLPLVTDVCRQAQSRRVYHPEHRLCGAGLLTLAHDAYSEANEKYRC